MVLYHVSHMFKIDNEIVTLSGWFKTHFLPE